VIVSRLVSGLVGAWVLGLRATIRIEEIHSERKRELKARGVPILYTLWHGRMVLPILAHLHESIVTMASRSKDGEIIARWLLRNGYIPARGSTRKGGAAALQEMIELVRAGHRLRVYVPFGMHWYEYSRRRLQENPAPLGCPARSGLVVAGALAQREDRIRLISARRAIKHEQDDYFRRRWRGGDERPAALRARGALSRRGRSAHGTGKAALPAGTELSDE
jgi:hypothetical protein